MIEMGFWWGVGVGMAAEFIGLLILGRVLTRRHTSSVTIHENGQTRVVKAPPKARQPRVKNGVRVSPNDVVGAGENVQAVIRREVRSEEGHAVIRREVR
jgi:hypothetical protein